MMFVSPCRNAANNGAVVSG